MKYFSEVRFKRSSVNVLLRYNDLKAVNVIGFNSDVALSLQGGVYMISQDNRVYIGITKNLNNRIRTHVSNISNNKMFKQYTREQMFNKNKPIEIYVLDTFDSYDDKYARFLEYLYSMVYSGEGFEVMNNYSIGSQHIKILDKLY